MSHKNVDFDKVFNLSLTALRIIGAHPSIPHDKKWFFRCILMHGIYTFVFTLFAFNVYLNIRVDNLTTACQNGAISIIYCVISFQYYILLANRTTLAKIIDMMRDDFKKDMSEDAKDIVHAYAGKGRSVCVQWLVVVVSVVIVFLTKHIILELYTCITDDFKLLQIFPLTYPAPLEEHKEDAVVFIILYIFFLHYLLYSSTMYLGFVPLGPLFMIHACGQLEIVKKEIMSLYVDNSDLEIKVKLNGIIVHLQYIYCFVDHIKTVFRLVYELTLRATTIILPFVVLGAFKGAGFSIEFAIMLFGSGLISATPCYYGDKLMEKSEDIRLAIYSCGWETRYNHGVWKTLLFILLRTLRPMAIRTIFRTLCLDVLTDCFRQAYALFNLLNANNAAWE